LGARYRQPASYLPEAPVNIGCMNIPKKHQAELAKLCELLRQALTADSRETSIEILSEAPDRSKAASVRQPEFIGAILDNLRSGCPAEEVPLPLGTES
jgi:hypothetical protein